jgi:hypothetical protein
LSRDYPHPLWCKGFSKKISILILLNANDLQIN